MEDLLSGSLGYLSHKLLWFSGIQRAIRRPCVQQYRYFLQPSLMLAENCQGSDNSAPIRLFLTVSS
jgi:hypothetical protein